MTDMIFLLAAACALWLLCFSFGQVLLLLFPGCPGEEVVHPRFARLGRRPVLALAGAGLVLGILLLAPALRHWLG